MAPVIDGSRAVELPAPHEESEGTVLSPVIDAPPGPLFSPGSRDFLKSIDALCEELRGSSADQDRSLEEFVRPQVLRDPAGEDPLHKPDIYRPLQPEPEPFFRWYTGAPLGFTGPSGVLPTESQVDSHFVPMEDRWRSGFSEWDRYDKGFPPVVDYPYKRGDWWNPYTQNVLKGDYPIIGQHTFLNLTLENLMLFDVRQVPTATTPFESTVDPNQEEFFGDPDQFLFVDEVIFSIDLFHGDAAFKPVDWRIKITPVFNANDLQVDELGIVNTDVRAGTRRIRSFFALQEWFFETKLADTSPNYDFTSLRLGSQLFVSDFRGFIFNDVNRAVRLFGTRHANQDQFNIIWFDQTEKDTNSLLNTFDDRLQNTVIMNYFRQDFMHPGYTAEVSFHFNHDEASTKFDENNFLVRPDPAGVFAPHEVNSFYIGFAGDGHIDRININNAFYWVLGRDTLNPIAASKQTINAQMAALELSIDRDWAAIHGRFG